MEMPQFNISTFKYALMLLPCPITNAVVAGG